MLVSKNLFKGIQVTPSGSAPIAILIPPTLKIPAT
jgi:hypothetical protein